MTPDMTLRAGRQGWVADLYRERVRMIAQWAEGGRTAVFKTRGLIAGAIGTLAAGLPSGAHVVRLNQVYLSSAGAARKPDAVIGTVGSNNHKFWC